MEIEYLLKKDEYLEAHSLYRSKMTGLKYNQIASPIIIVVGIFVILISLDISSYFDIFNMILGILFLLFGIFNLFGLFSLEKISVKIQIRNWKIFSEIQKVKFNDDIIEFEREGIKSYVEWKYYPKYYEGKNVFVLIHDKSEFSIHPKYVFKDKLDDFRSMLARNIK